jgi:hypothetical protein
MAPTFNVVLAHPAMTDAGRERVVDRRVAQRAGDADGDNLSIAIDPASHADDGVQSQKFGGDARISEIDLVLLERLDEFRRQCVHIHLEADGQGRCRIDPGERLVHPEKAGPELLVAERVESEDRSSDVKPVDRGSLFVVLLRAGRETNRRYRDRRQEHRKGRTDESHTASLLSCGTSCRADRPLGRAATGRPDHWSGERMKRDTA